jgi:predicted permease
LIRDFLTLDVRQILRGLLRRPAVPAAVVLTLALGVGANASVFAIVDRLLLRAPAAVSDPSAVRRLYAIQPTEGRASVRDNFTVPEFQDLSAALGASAAAAAYFNNDARVGENAERGTQVSAGWITSNYFRLLGTRPAIGRDFSDSEGDLANAARVAVLSYEYWRREYQQSPAVLGRDLFVDGEPYTVVGVAQKDFAGVDFSKVDIWLPLGAYSGFNVPGHPWWQDRGLRVLSVVTRFSDNANSESVAEIAEAAIHRGNANAGFGDTLSHVVLGPIQAARGPQQLSTEESISAGLSAFALLVLLIAAANVGNLLIVRTLRRRKEISVRLALGITRTRLASQLIGEALILAVISGLAAFLIATWLSSLLRTVLFPDVSWPGNPADSRVFVVALVLACITGVLAALGPIFEALRGEPFGNLNSGLRTGSRRAGAIQGALLISQTGLSLVLLVGAALYLRSLARVYDVDPGYDVQHLASVSPGQSSARLPASELAQRLKGVPGVGDIAFTAVRPIEGMLVARLYRQNGDSLPLASRGAGYMVVSPNFLDVAGLRVLRGRSLQAGDVAGSAPVTVVSSSFANAAWPGEDPIGRCFHVLATDSPCYEVVGIAEDAAGMQLLGPPALIFYLTINQSRQALTASTLLVRTIGNPELVARRIDDALGRGEGVYDFEVAAIPARLAPQYRPWKLGAQLFVGMAILALLVAAMGLYSVMAYAVASRKRDLGIRLALGASPSRLTRQIVGEAVRRALVGLLCGALVALAAGRLIAAQLYRTSPYDIPALVTASAVLVASAVLASLIPARRASRVDLLESLRSE